MRKKVLFLSLIAILVFNIICVNAETTYPYTVTEGDYSFEIEGFAFKVYPKTKDGDSNVTDEELSNYLHNIAEETPIASNVIEIEPEVEHNTVHDMDLYFIKLNTNIDEGLLEYLLEDQISEIENDTTNTKSYMIDLIVKYKVLTIPNNFNHLYINHFGKNLTDGLLSISDNQDTDTSMLDYMTETQINTTNFQVINMIEIYKDGNDEATLKYYNDAEELYEETQLAYYYNYLQLAEGETEEEINLPKNEWIFTNLTTTEPLLQFANDLYDAIIEGQESGNNNGDNTGEVPGEGNNTENNTNNNGDTAVIVAIPDTALSKSAIIVSLGIIAMILGGVILGKIYLNIEK